MIQFASSHLRRPVGLEFAIADRDVKVRVDGQLVLKTIAMRLNAALASFGLAYTFEDLVRVYVTAEPLAHWLANLNPPFSG
jgi:hypothetical protein